MRTEGRAFTPGFPCNTTATHPAAPLGSRRRSAPPLNFATRNLQKWQEVNEDELCDEEFARDFHVAFKRGAPKAAFKQKLVARVTRVTHVPRWSKIQVRSPGACRLQGRLQSAERHTASLKATFKHLSDLFPTKKKGLHGEVEYDTFRVVNRRVGPREGRILPSFT